MATHILIIRPGAIGDTLLTLPLLQHLRNRQSATAVTFVGNATVLPLLTTLGLAERVYDYEDMLWSYLFMPPASTGLSPRRQSLQTIVATCTEAICWLGDPESLVKDNLRAFGIPAITIAPGRPADTQEHITTYLASTVGANWRAGSGWQVPSNYTWQGTQSHPRTIVIHPGSGGKHKCWPLEHFAHLIRTLLQEDYRIQLLVGPAEQALFTRLKTLVPTTDSLQILYNEPLLSITTCLQHCHAYVGNDTGITHLAALLGIPTVAIFLPANVVQWQPIGEHVRLLQQDELGLLYPDVVLDTLASFSL